MKMIVWLLLLLAVAPGVSALESTLLAKGGDNMQWADPNLDDRGWQPVEVPGSLTKQGIKSVEGYAWYRVHFHQERAEPQPKVLSLGLIYEAYELFLNGQYVNQYSVLPQTGHDYVWAAKFRKVYLPAELMNPGGDNVLAIRVYSSQADIGIMDGQLQFAGVSGQTEIPDPGNLPYVFLVILSFSIFFISGLLMVDIGYFRSQLKEHLWLAGFFLSMAMTYLLENLHYLAESLKTPALQRLVLLFECAIPIFLLLYINQRYKYVLSRLQWAAILLLSAWVLTFLIWDMPISYVGAYGDTGFVLLLFIAILIVLQTAKAVRQRQPEAFIILCGFMSATAGILLYLGGYSYLIWGVEPVTLGLLGMVLLLLQSVAVRAGRERRLLAKYAQKILTVQETERSYFARELHDSLGSSLALTKMRLDTAGDDCHDEVRTAVNELDDCIGEVRRIASGLHPIVLERKSLGAAITESVNQHSGDCRFVLDVDTENDQVDIIVKTHLFRIFQEAVKNAVQHGKASAIEVVYRLEKAFFVLQIKDNGQGFTVQDNDEKSLGLHSMKERADQCSGVLIVESKPGEGSRITVKVPQND